MPLTDFFHGQPLIGALLTGLLGLLAGAGLMVVFNIRKYRGKSRSVELSRRLQDAESRYE